MSLQGLAVGWWLVAGSEGSFLFATMDDFIRTLDSDGEDALIDNNARKKLKKGSEKLPDEGVALNPDFTFDLTGDVYQALPEYSALQDEIKTGSKPVSNTIIGSNRDILFIRF